MHSTSLLKLLKILAGLMETATKKKEAEAEKKKQFPSFLCGEIVALDYYIEFDKLTSQADSQ